MELIYLYVGKVGRPLSNFGICFSRKFKVDFNASTGKLYILDNVCKLSNTSIYGENIKDIDLIVGKNGCGKSTILSLLGLSRTERLLEFPFYLNENIETKDDEKCTWFALYYIEDDYFAIEGNWCDVIEFMRGDRFDHFQNLYSLYFRYDFEKHTSNIVWHLQDLRINRKKEFHKKLFFLYYENPITLEWVNTRGRIHRNDHGSSYMFERIFCDRVGYQGIVRYLYAANHESEFVEFMGTKPGTKIRISVNDNSLTSVKEFLDDTIASSFYLIDSLGSVSIDEEKINDCIYGGKLSIIERVILSIPREGKIVNNGLRYKEAFVISYLEQIVLFFIMKQKTMVRFPIDEKLVSQSQYEWQKSHLIKILERLIGDDIFDLKLTINIVTGLEKIPEEYFVSYLELEVLPSEMQDNFLDYLMMQLDDDRRNIDNHTVNHGYFLKTKFFGISSGEAKMIDIFAMLYNSLNYCNHDKDDTCVLLLDEPDIGFHPEWSRIFIENLTKFLNSKIVKSRKFHVIISTHSPMMLSDVPKYCIHCISKDIDGSVNVKDSDKFGLVSSINDILIDDFFTDSVFGSFGEKYVNEIIQNINDLELRIESELVKGGIDSSAISDYRIKCDAISDKLECLGDGYVKSSIHRRLNRIRTLCR